MLADFETNRNYRSFNTSKLTFRRHHIHYTSLNGKTIFNTCYNICLKSSLILDINLLLISSINFLQFLHTFFKLYQYVIRIVVLTQKCSTLVNIVRTCINVFLCQACPSTCVNHCVSRRRFRYSLWKSYKSQTILIGQTGNYPTEQWPVCYHDVHSPRCVFSCNPRVSLR